MLHIPTWLILLIAAVNCLVYLFLVPPWQHYDEPGNFEYVWLMARLNHIPSSGEVDYAVRREISASMIERNFFRNMGGTPNLINLQEPTWIGISQLDDLPLYYFIASLPVRLFSHTDVTLQLYNARLVSLCLFLFTVWVGRKGTSEWFGEKHEITWLVSLMLATLPGFVELMTAVNNDVGAAASFTFFFWMAGSIIHKKISFLKFILFILSILTCYFVKTTAWLALLLVPIVLILALPIRQQLEWLRFIAIIIAVILFFYFIFNLHEQIPLYFYGNNSKGLRSEERSSIIGKRVFAIKGNSEMNQLIPDPSINMIKGKTITLGAWMWAEKECESEFLDLVVDGKSMGGNKQISLKTYPQFFQNNITIPTAATSGTVLLTFENSSPDNTIYLDGIVFVDGLYNMGEVPQFADSQAAKGIWQGKPFVNIIRNASAEHYLPVLSEWSQQIFTRGRVNSLYFWSLFDYKGAGWFYDQSLRTLFRTFWGQFGWGHVPFLWDWVYTGLLIFIFVVLFGIVWGLLQDLTKYWKLILFGSLVVGGQLVLVLLRGAGTWESHILYPSARYFFPAILPSCIILCGGWYQIGKIMPFSKSISISSKIMIGLLAIVNIVAWISIGRYYYGGLR